MSKDAGRRLRFAVMLAVAAALAVAGVASARGTGSDSAGTATPKAKDAPTPPKAGPDGKSGPMPGSPPPPAIGGPQADLTNGVLHVRGEDGKEETIRLDQGKITAIDDGSLTLKENDGSTVTVKVDDDTAVMDPGAGPGKGSLDDLETGDEVTTSGPEGEAAATVAVVPTGGNAAKAGPKGGAGAPGPLPAPPTKGSAGDEKAPSGAGPSPAA